MEEAKRGACYSCRFFIQDRKELAQELHTIVRRHPLLITPRRRTGQAFTVHQPDGTSEQVRTQSNDIEREVLTLEDLAHALHDWFPHVMPWDIGLCELGVADIVTAQAGAEPGTECARWQGRGAIIQLRPPDWHERRREALSRAGMKAIALSDPCPCKSGKIFADCHGAAKKGGGAA